MHAPHDDETGFKVEMVPSHAWNGQATVSLTTLGDTQMANLSDADRRVMRARRRRQLTPEQIIEAVRETEGHGVSGSGSFVEYDLDEAGAFGPRPEGAPRREANLIVGLMSHPHERWRSGLERVFLLGDVTRTMGSLAEAECARVIAALDLAEARSVPVEWISFSSGARIAFDSGTENLDWTARVLRRIIEFTQAGGTIHVLVDGPCVGAQSYWNAEATMLNHCRGALFMTPRGYMILTGKRALEHSGCVSGASNEAIGGLGIMAPNGEAQYVAATLAGAYEMLLRHYALTYVEPGREYTARVDATDARDRDLTGEPYTAKEGGFATIGEIFSDETNAGRKRPFDIRAVMRATLDRDIEPLERWAGLEGGESAVVFHGQLGGQPVCMVGIESMPIGRKGTSPTHGPSAWTSGTLYPRVLAQGRARDPRRLRRQAGRRAREPLGLRRLAGVAAQPPARVRRRDRARGREFPRPDLVLRDLALPRRRVRRLLARSQRPTSRRSRSRARSPR